MMTTATVPDESPTASPAPASIACYSPRPPPPFHILELTVLSAQEIAVPSPRRPTYAVVWVDSVHKVSTTLDPSGSAFPSWNDRFVFRVPHAFLASDTAAVTIQIRSSVRRIPILGPLLRRLRPDPVLGTARLVVSTMRPTGLFPTPSFVALQVRRPSSRPQGMVNVGVALLDGSVSALPSYYEAGAPPAVACRELGGCEWEEGNRWGTEMVGKKKAALGRIPSEVDDPWKEKEKEKEKERDKDEEERKSRKGDGWREEEDEEPSSRRRSRRSRGLSCFCGAEAVHGYEDADW